MEERYVPPPKPGEKAKTAIKKGLSQFIDGILDGIALAVDDAKNKARLEINKRLDLEEVGGPTDPSSDRSLVVRQDKDKR